MFQATVYPAGCIHIVAIHNDAGDILHFFLKFLATVWIMVATLLFSLSTLVWMYIHNVASSYSFGFLLLLHGKIHTNLKSFTIWLTNSIAKQVFKLWKLWKTPTGKYFIQIYENLFSS